MNRLRRAWQILRLGGARAALRKGILRLFPFVLDRPMLVDEATLLAVDWRAPGRWSTHPRRVLSDRPVVAWLMSPPGSNSGGHQNIFRFIHILESAGYEVRIYLSSRVDPTTAAEARARVTSSSSYPDLAATIDRYPALGVPDDVDALVATGWETAYVSFLDPSDARRFYFVQDFEPLFAPASSEAVFAENSYRLGFTGITAGRWLTEKLADEYGMDVSPFDFGAGREYSRITTDRRTSVFFYARPETPRRGFELGVLALRIVARERPGSAIILAGQNLGSTDLGFPHDNPGNLHVGELNALYNQCAAALVLSFTNMSLLPLELLAAGVIPVVNDAPNNRRVSSNPFIAYAQPSPRALADRLIEVIDRADQTEHSARAAQSVADLSWERAGTQFLEAFERGIRG